MSRLRSRLGDFLPHLRRHFASVPPDMYLRLERVDALLQALHSMQANAELCAGQINSLAAGLPGMACSLEQRISACERQIDGLIASANAETAKRFDELTVRVARLSYAASLAAKIGHTGEYENLLYCALIGSEKPLSDAAAPVPLSSSLCQQVHFALDQYRFWIQEMKDKPRFLRKQWEFFFIAQILFERGMLQGGRAGIGFGIGLEPLPALFASLGVQVLATDQSYDQAERAGWVRSGEHSTELSSLNARGICPETTFRQLVQFAPVDMNAVSPDFEGRFDFCWSACALEHLGSLRHGMEFIKKSLNVLKPGGIAVHTTEFNMSSDARTIESEALSVYRRRDIEQLIREVEAEGHSVEPIDWRHGGGLAETVVDLPPWGRGEPHIRILLAEFECTSIGLVLRRHGDDLSR